MKGELGIRKSWEDKFSRLSKYSKASSGAENEGAIAFMANNTLSVALKYSSMFQVSVGGSE